MFRKFLQTSTPEGNASVGEEVRNAVPVAPPPALSSQAAPSALGPSERNRSESHLNSKLSTFDDIYRKSSFKTPTSTAAWTF